MLINHKTIMFRDTELVIEYSWDDETLCDVVVMCGHQDITDLVSKTTMSLIEDRLYDSYGEDMACAAEAYREYSMER